MTVSLSESSARRIRDAVLAVEAGEAGGGPRGSRFATGGRDVQVVRVAAETPPSQSRGPMPGYVQEYDWSTKTWDDGVACWAVWLGDDPASAPALDGSGGNCGRYLAQRWADDAGTGRPVFVVGDVEGAQRWDSTFGYNHPVGPHCHHLLVNATGTVTPPSELIVPGLTPPKNSAGHFTPHRLFVTNFGDSVSVRLVHDDGSTPALERFILPGSANFVIAPRCGIGLVHYDQWRLIDSPGAGGSTTLTGAVTGSGTGTIATTLSAAAVAGALDSLGGVTSNF